MQRYMDVVRQASALHADGHLDQAAFLYEHLLGAAPTDSVVMYMLGTLYSQQARFGSAIILLQTAVSESPELDAAWHNLGVAYRNEGHIELAREAYQKCLDGNGKNPEALAMMAGTFVNTGAPEKGIEWADKSLPWSLTTHTRLTRNRCAFWNWDDTRKRGPSMATASSCRT